MVGSGYRPGHGEFARGVHLTRQQVGNRVATLHTGLPGAENSIGITTPRSRLDDTTRVNNYNDGFAHSVESVADIHDQRTLLGDEVELGVQVAVDALASLTAYGDDSGIGSFFLVVDAEGVDGYLRIFLLSELLILIPLGRMTLGLELHLSIFDILAIDIGERRCCADAGILQTFEHVDDIGRMNTARTRTTAEEVVGVLAEQGNGLDGAIFPR